MSHFTFPLGLHPDYIPLEQRKPKPKQIPEGIEVRTNKERLKFSKEVGVGVHFFISGKRDTRIRLIEILGKGDMRVGYARLLKFYDKLTIEYDAMFKELKQHSNGADFSRYLKRVPSFIGATEQSFRKVGGIKSYKAFKTARTTLKKYAIYKGENMMKSVEKMNKGKK